MKIFSHFIHTFITTNGSNAENIIIIIISFHKRDGTWLLLFHSFICTQIFTHIHCRPSFTLRRVRWCTPHKAWIINGVPSGNSSGSGSSFTYMTVTIIIKYHHTHIAWHLFTLFCAEIKLMPCHSFISGRRCRRSSSVLSATKMLDKILPFADERMCVCVCILCMCERVIFVCIIPCSTQVKSEKISFCLVWFWLSFVLLPADFILHVMLAINIYIKYSLKSLLFTLNKWICFNFTPFPVSHAPSLSLALLSSDAFRRMDIDFQCDTWYTHTTHYTLFTFNWRKDTHTRRLIQIYRPIKPDVVVICLYWSPQKTGYFIDVTCVWVCGENLIS